MGVPGTLQPEESPTWIPFAWPFCVLYNRKKISLNYFCFDIRIPVLHLFWPVIKLETYNGMSFHKMVLVFLFLFVILKIGMTMMGFTMIWLIMGGGGEGIPAV